MKLFLISVCFGLVYGRLPVGTFEKCTRDEREMVKCILEGVEAIRPLLINGIPGIDFPRLEPFKMTKLAIDTSLPGLKLKGEATNIEATGAGDFRIENLDLDLDKMTAGMTILIPKLEVTADYSIKVSKIIFFNFATTGKFTGSFNDVRAVLSFRGRLDTEDALDYLRIPHVKAKVEIGRGSTIHIDPEDNKIASKWAAKIVNIAPTKLVLKMLQSSINKTAGQIIKKYLNRVLDDIPIQETLED